MIFENADEGHPEYKEGEEPFHFFYNREERIKNAPQIVQDYYSGKMNPTKGLFRVMFKSRGNRFLFGGIVVFIAFIFLFNFLSSRKQGKIFGTTAELTAFSYEEQIYVSLELKESSKKDIPVPFHAVFTATDSSGGEEFRQEKDCQYDGTNLFVRTKFNDYDIIKVTCEVQSGTDEKDNRTFNVPVVQHH